MGSKSSKKVRVPAPAAPTAVPGMLSQSVAGAGENARRKMMANLGREGTILTGLGGARSQLSGQVSLGTTTSSAPAKAKATPTYAGSNNSMLGMFLKAMKPQERSAMTQVLKSKLG